MAALWTRPPVGEEDDKVARTYIPVTVEVSRANWRARTPVPNRIRKSDTPTLPLASTSHGRSRTPTVFAGIQLGAHGRTGNSDRYTHGSRLLHSVGKIRPRTGP